MSDTPWTDEHQITIQGDPVVPADNVRQLERDRAELIEALRQYMLAQSRMRDKWAEGDDAVKNDLWRNLHALEDGARDLLARLRAEDGKVSEPAHALEPDGGNLYRNHLLQFTSGQFWRCKHGLTGFTNEMDWTGCAKCAKYDPAAFAKWRAKDGKP